MDEKLKNELMAVISGAISETNAKWDEYYASVQAKEAEIAQLRADMEKYQAEKAAAEAGLSEANAKITELENERSRAELNSALEPYSEEQRAVAQDDIDAFNANPGSVEINSIIGKICTEMVRVAREASKVAETNASNIDVFGMTEETKPHSDDGDVEVF